MLSSIGSVPDQPQLIFRDWDEVPDQIPVAKIFGNVFRNVTRRTDRGVVRKYASIASRPGMDATAGLWLITWFPLSQTFTAEGRKVADVAQEGVNVKTTIQYSVFISSECIHSQAGAFFKKGKMISKHLVRSIWFGLHV